MRRMRRMFSRLSSFRPVVEAAVLLGLPQMLLAGGEGMSISAGSLSLKCDAVSGRFSLSDCAKGRIISGATAAVELHDKTVRLSDSRFSHRVEETSSAERLLPGRQILLSSTDELQECRLELRATLLSELPGAVFELCLQNLGTTDLELRSLEPLRAVLNENASCQFDCSKVLTNGRIYYDPGKLIEFAPQQSTEMTSFYNAAFHAPATGETLVAGFLDNVDGEGYIRGRRGGGPRFELSAQSRLHSRVLLKPGTTITSGRLLVLISPDGFSGLETYADLSGRLHRVRLNPILNGWSTWSCYYSDIHEEEVLKNAEFIARELKPYGMEWVQIDDGFQRSFGDWEGKVDRFPTGMKGTAEKVRELGLKAGLWIAPYAVSSVSPLAQEHPEWLARRADGELQPIVEAHQGQAQYILDVTHPGARQWLRDLLHRLTEEWGYDFIKTDFSEWTLLSQERYFDPTASASRAYRIGVEAMRQGMGALRHMLDCGPGPSALGLIDSMRIELDRPIPENPLWDQYAGHFNSTGPAVAKRYYFHKRTWINDADHIRMVGLTLPQSVAAATITALSGGTMIAGDCLYKLDSDRVQILKRVFPAYGEAARPLDLFATDSPELFHLPLHKTWGKWSLLGCFNWSPALRDRLLDVQSLGLEPGKTFLVYDYWSQQLLAETSGTMSLKQEPTSVNLLSIRERSGVPQVLGTDRHFTQGGIELEQVQWDEAGRVLSGTALGKPGMAWKLAVYTPEEFSPDAEKSRGISLDRESGQARVLHGKLSFEGQAEEIAWKIQFR